MASAGQSLAVARTEVPQVSPLFYVICLCVYHTRSNEKSFSRAVAHGTLRVGRILCFRTNQAPPSPANPLLKTVFSGILFPYNACKVGRSLLRPISSLVFGKDR